MKVDIKMMSSQSVFGGDRLRLSAILGVMLCGVPAWAGTPTTTTLAVTTGGNPVSSISSGSVVTLTATVKAGATAVKPGTVNFCNAAAAYCTDITLLGSAQLTANGTASIKFKPGVGSHSYKAVFVGTTAHSSSSSAARPLTVTGLNLSETGFWPTVNGSDFNFSVELGGNASAAPSGMASLLDASNGNAEIASARIKTYPGERFLPVNLEIAASQVFLSQVVVADFNGDGIPDLAISMDAPSPYPAGIFVTVYLGNGDGTFTAKTPISVGNDYASAPWFPVVGDFNGDGVPDLVFTSNPGNGGGSPVSSAIIYLGSGDGTFTQGAQLSGGGGLPLVGDFNGDGNLDIATLTGADGISVWLGKGDGTFSSTPVVTPLNLPFGTIDPGTTRWVTGDFNGDGILDLATDLSKTSTGEVTIYQGDGSGAFTAKPIQAVGKNLDYMVAGDFTGNGNLDLALIDPTGNGGPSSLVVLLNNGNGTFTSNTYPLPNNLGGLPTLADFNQDGIPDLALLVGKPSAAVLIGKGDGTFTVGPSLDLSGDGTICAASGDFNGDGVPDLAVCDYNGNSLMKILLTENKTASAEFTGVSVDPKHEIVASFPGDAKYKPGTSQPMQPCHVIPKERNCG